jgi:ABC-2 type transport system permease protein
MTLLNVERIKLFSTRSPYWCLVAIAVAALGFATLFGLVDEGRAAIPYLILRGTNLGMSIFMVLAALAVTTEYRFGTIKNSFLAVPRRPSVLAAKTLLLALLGLVVGFVAAMAAFFLAKALATAPLAPLELSSADDWREVAGYGPLFAIAGVIAVAVGTIVRQSAGAVAILLLWPLLVESLFTLIPTVGEKAGPWLPFAAADRWVSPTSSVSDLFQSSTTGPTPVQGLLVFAAAALVLWLIALVLLQKRDA